MNSLVWMLDTVVGDSASNAAGNLQKDVENVWNNVVHPVFKTVLWVLVAALALFLIVKAVMTAMAVMKAADEPQVRQEKIQGFKYLAIALVIAIVVLSFANVIIDMVTKNATITGGTKSSTTFLF